MLATIPILVVGVMYGWRLGRRASVAFGLAPVLTLRVSEEGVDLVGPWRLSGPKVLSLRGRRVVRMAHWGGVTNARKPTGGEHHFEVEVGRYGDANHAYLSETILFALTDEQIAFVRAALREHGVELRYTEKPEG